MPETAMVKPTNKIVVDSTNLHLQTKKVETATNVYPGRLVEKGTNDDDVVVCGGSNPAVGVAGYEQTTKNYRPATVDTIYAQNDQIAVINGPGVIAVLSLASGEATVKGTLLKSAAAGEVAAGTAGTDHIYAIAEETVAGAAGSRDVMARLLF